MSVKGIQGMSGPASICNFEIKEGYWCQEHVELQNLCFTIVEFLSKHPDIATKVEISKDSMISTLLDSEET